jgi:hypothetical protein
MNQMIDLVNSDGIFKKNKPPVMLISEMFFSDLAQ